MTITFLVSAAVLILVPGIPLVVAWYHVLAHVYPLRPFLRIGLPLLVITVSMLLFMTAPFVPAAIGHDYSTRRFVTIYSNFFIALLMLVLAITARRPLGWMVASSAAAVAIVWLYLGVVSSVV